MEGFFVCQVLFIYYATSLLHCFLQVSRVWNTCGKDYTVDEFPSWTYMQYTVTVTLPKIYVWQHLIIIIITCSILHIQHMYKHNIERLHTSIRSIPLSAWKELTSMTTTSARTVGTSVLVGSLAAMDSLLLVEVAGCCWYECSGCKSLCNTKQWSPHHLSSCHYLSFQTHKERHRTSLSSM